MTIRHRIDRFFALAARTLVRLRWPALILILLPTLLVASQVRRLSIDTSNEGLLHPDDPILTAYDEFRDVFGRDDLLVIAVQSEQVFSLSFLQRLKALHEELEAGVPHLYDIVSLVNARDTRGEGDTLLVDDLLLHFPRTEAEVQAVRARAMANPVYRNQLLSEDGTFTTILLESDTYSAAGGGESDLLSGFEDDSAAGGADGRPAFLTDRENAAMVRKAQAIAAKYDAPDFRIYIAGSPIVTHTVKQLMMQDMKRFLRLAVLTIGLCLFLMFRRISGVFLPLVVVALTLMATLGCMAVTGTQFKVPTIILPSFLLAVGVGASVHVLALFYHRLDGGMAKAAAIEFALSHSGLAIVMTSLTTAAGLASFAAAEVAPIADLGLFSALGVLLSLVYTVFLLPTLLAILPVRRRAAGQRARASRFDRFLDFATRVSTTRPKTILGITVLLVGLSASGIPRIDFSHNMLAWLPANLPVRVATGVIDKELRGSVALEVVLDTGVENGLYDQRLLLALDRLGRELEQYRRDDLFVGKVVSVTTILKEIHQALHENRPEMYKIPDNAALIPQEFLLFENSGSDDLRDFVDTRFSKARITIKVPWRDALAYVPFIGEIERRFQQAFADIRVQGHPVQVTTTGIMSLFARILYATMYSAAQSYVIALVVITLLMIILIGDLKMGCIAMAPNISPILVVMGIMGHLHIPLDMFTMLVASIAIGLAVDDTIHFVYHFRNYYLETGDVGQAVGRTLHTAGRAMLTTSIVLSLGFFIFGFASMHNVKNFGILVGIAIVIALLADFFLAPALMALAIGRRPVNPSQTGATP